MKLSDLQDISARQKTSLDRQDMGYLRHILPSLPDIQSHALIISGIRRCGKSTLLRQFMHKRQSPFFYLNFDDIRLASFTHEDYSLLDRVIGESGSRLIFFDEIQSAVNWELYIRQELDEGFSIAITGSNASLLSRELGSRLTGRHLSRELFPFSYGEFCSYLKLDPCAQSLVTYLEKGGFPEYLSTDNTDILSQLQSDIIYRDIAVRYGIRDTASLKQLYVYLVSNPAQLFSPSRLTEIIGIKSPTTILEYISHFISAYLINLLPCFAWSVKKQSLAPKKVYVCDTGLIQTGAVSFSRNDGAFLENFVYNSFRINSDITVPINNNIFYYHDRNNSECDFIIRLKDSTKCVQVCWEMNADNQDREINGLLDAMDFFDEKEGEIITFNQKDIICTGGKKIGVRPAWQF